jgi:hypothetical protein
MANADLYYTASLVPQPATASDWQLCLVDGGDVDIAAPPSVNELAGLPAVAYGVYAPVFDVAYARADSVVPLPGSWTYTAHVAFGATTTAFDLVSRNGRPTIFYDNAGLQYMRGAIAQPGQFADWTEYSANPSFTQPGDFRHLSADSSGPFTFAAGVVASPEPYVVVNFAGFAEPIVPGDFVEYLLQPVGSLESDPALCVIDGIPCVAAADYSFSRGQQPQRCFGRQLESAQHIPECHGVHAPRPADARWQAGSLLGGQRSAFRVGTRQQPRGAGRLVHHGHRTGCRAMPAGAGQCRGAAGDRLLSRVRPWTE